MLCPVDIKVDGLDHRRLFGKLDCLMISVMAGYI